MVEMEKKMTDEEIVASLECCRKNDLEDTCAYCIGCPASNYYALDYEGDEECIGYVMRKAIETIQRLTEENAILKGNPPMCVGRSNGKTIRAKLLAFDKMKERNAELQKQVDALMGFKNEAISMSLYGKGRKDGAEVAVKDMAKEILTDAKKWVKEHYKDTVTDSFGERPMLFMEAFGCLLAYLKDKHGVEVEHVGITVDKEELIKALQFDRGQYDRGYADACKKFVGLLHERMRYKYQGTGLWWTEIVLMAEEICKEITEVKEG